MKSDFGAKLSAVIVIGLGLCGGATRARPEC
jgi:hypothetical protein